MSQATTPTPTATEHHAARQLQADNIRTMLASIGAKLGTITAQRLEGAYLIGYAQALQAAGLPAEPYLTMLLMSGRQLTAEFPAIVPPKAA